MCKSIVNDLRHGNYICKLHISYLGGGEEGLLVVTQLPRNGFYTEETDNIRNDIGKNHVQALLLHPVEFTYVNQ
jgi:hypothetical protein